MSDFLEKKSWENIERGYEYEAAIMFPTDTKRPLSFFIPDENDSNTGRVVNSVGDFKPVYKEGKPRALTQQVIVSLKPRKVVIVTTDEINQNPEFEYVLVSPIHTIKEHEKAKNWYELVKKHAHPIFSYFPNKDFERYIDLSQTVSIHKSLILRKSKKVDEKYWDILEENLIQCLSLGIFEEVEEVEEAKE